MFHIEPGLSRMNSVLEVLGHPERRFKVIHIAGTNGKGSVSACLESVLRTSGYKTGLYTSPHLVDLRERIQVNRHWIPIRSFAKISRVIFSAEQTLQIKLTYFEFTTVIAFIYFAEANVDIALIEAGMGGRLDATNVFTNPLASVITSISLDHTTWLGKTVDLIAKEKAGIIRPNGCVIAGVRGTGSKVIQRVAESQKAILSLIDREFSASPIKTHWENGCQEFSYKRLGEPTSTWRISLLGPHQLDNAAISLTVIERLRRLGFRLSKRNILQGLLHAQWDGRFQIIQKPNYPVIILDAAHNPDGTRRLAETFLQSPWRKKRVHLLFGVYKDKDYEVMLKNLEPLVSSATFCCTDLSRGLSESNAADIFRTLCNSRKTVYMKHSISVAVRHVLNKVSKDEIILVTGSIALIGKASSFLKKLYS